LESISGELLIRSRIVRRSSARRSFEDGAIEMLMEVASSSD